MTSQFIDCLKQRRTQYALGKTLPITQDAVITLIQEAVKHSPSSFNSQSSRVVILFGEHSNKVWDITKETLRTMVSAEQFEKTAAKLDSFAAGAGTILFYEDQATVKNLQEKFPSYAENFPIWSEQAGGMAQLAVWTALANANIGASLQHYNPIIDETLATTFDIPSEWKLRAQMPFGENKAAFSEKAFIDDNLRFKIFR